MDVKYPSKERVERDGYLVYAEGDELAGDPDEMTRQGYEPDSVLVVVSGERVERDGILVYTEGDDISADPDEIARQAAKEAKPADETKEAKPSPASKAKK